MFKTLVAIAVTAALSGCFSDSRPVDAVPSPQSRLTRPTPTVDCATIGRDLLIASAGFKALVTAEGEEASVRIHADFANGHTDRPTYDRNSPVTRALGEVSARQNSLLETIIGSECRLSRVEFKEWDFEGSPILKNLI